MNAASSSLNLRLARNVDRTFEEVVITFQQPLFAMAYALCASRQDAEEAVQDVFIRAHRALSGYGEGRIRELSLQAWLYRICLNQVRNRRRKSVPPTESFDTQCHSPVSFDAPSRRLERQEAADELARSLSQLSPSRRQAVVLRFVNDLSYAEIAAILDQPEATVRSSVHRGLASLRHILSSGEAA
jgi:RNA polymerase sigma-70 factor (ECF subfamily)